MQPAEEEEDVDSDAESVLSLPVSEGDDEAEECPEEDLLVLIDDEQE